MNLTDLNSVESIIYEAGRVAQFIMKCKKQWPARCNKPYPTDDYAYARKLASWKEDGKPGISFFATEDNLFLEFKDEIETEFGLKVVSEKEGRKLEIDLDERVERAFEFGILGMELPTGLA